MTDQEYPTGTEFMKIVLSAKENESTGHITIETAAYPREGFEFPKGAHLFLYAKTLITAMKTASEARTDEEKAANREEIRALLSQIAAKGADVK